MGEIRVKSGNLLDISKEIKNEGLAGHGTTTVSSISNHSDYIAIRPDTSYTINHDNNDSVNRLIQFFNRHKTFVMEIYDNVTFPNTFITPSNAYFMRFAYSNHATNITLVEGSTALPYQPYFLNLPSHEKTSTGWKDIPTHTMTANGWQGELTSQSPLEFRATGQSLLDWRIDGASGGVGDWDETEQRYAIPVTVNGTTTNLYTTAQLMDGDSLDFATDQTTIPITQGDNTLTVGTAVQPKSVFVKFEG